MSKDAPAAPAPETKPKAAPAAAAVTEETWTAQSGGDYALDRDVPSQDYVNAPPAQVDFVFDGASETAPQS